MKLLIVTQIVDRNDDLLGAFHQWIVRFAEVFESVEVICLKEGEHRLPENVSVHSLGKERRRSRLQYLRNFFRYVFILRGRYDAVFVHMNPEYVMLAGALWKLWKKPVFLWYAHKRGSWMRKAVLPLLDRVVSVSKESFVGNASKKFLAVGHGVDPDVYACERATTGGRPVIMHVGRLSPVKDYERLVGAADLLRRKHGRGDFLVRLVGAPANPEDKAYVERLERDIEERGLTDLFEFFGSVPNKDVRPMLCEASVFVSMQCQGGAGKSFLEAMSCGVPTVVCTPVFNPHTGAWKDRLYYDGSPEDFAEKLDRCLSLSEGQRKEVSSMLRGIVVEHHNLKNLVRRVKDEMRKVRAL